MTENARATTEALPSLVPEMLVLVADDDDDMRLYIRNCLGSRGAVRVVEAADGDEAFELAQTLHPDLIVSDLVMPGLDGDALCSAIKADAQTCNIPFLLVSGESRKGHSCADAFLAKPFNAASLRGEVERLL